jgi:hypothetical protein
VTTAPTVCTLRCCLEIVLQCAMDVYLMWHVADVRCSLYMRKPSVYFITGSNVGKFKVDTIVFGPLSVRGGCTTVLVSPEKHHVITQHKFRRIL